MKKKLETLPTWAKRLLGVAGAVDIVLRLCAIADIANRPEEELNGPKKVWLPALAMVSSLGLLPAAYFAMGRRQEP